MFEQFSQEARAAVSAAHEEARMRGDRRLGTEHLFLGVLPTEGAARAVGVDLETARATLGALDLAALAVVGIDARNVERVAIPASRNRTPFTSGARTVVKRTVIEARKAGSRRIEADHLLLAILSCARPDPAAELVEALHIVRAEVRDRLR
ncbi:Clp protease N-terminal domain-containing protein [Streptomyces sp. NPDC059256]|uniref:Clp protease N-terminal domain-containing protein n=1 Tax=Streptomyces sp. NPDC059256 TaxID=3346794 RepID=UPI00369CA6D3